MQQNNNNLNNQKNVVLLNVICTTLTILGVIAMLEIQPRIDDALEKGYLSKGTVPSEIGYEDVMIVVY